MLFNEGKDVFPGDQLLTVYDKTTVVGSAEAVCRKADAGFFLNGSVNASAAAGGAFLFSDPSEASADGTGCVFSPSASVSHNGNIAAIQNASVKTLPVFLFNPGIMNAVQPPDAAFIQDLRKLRAVAEGIVTDGKAWGIAELLFNPVLAADKIHDNAFAARHIDIHDIFAAQRGIASPLTVKPPQTLRLIGMFF